MIAVFSDTTSRFVNPYSHEERVHVTSRCLLSEKDNWNASWGDNAVEPMMMRTTRHP